MRIAKVMVSKPVLESFFRQSDRAFLPHKGVPEDAKLVKFQHQDGQWCATFEHDSFSDVGTGQSVPFLDVEYIQLKVVPKETVQ